MDKINRTSIPCFGSRLEWALHLSGMGFSVVPIAAGTKQTYQPWAGWEADQSREKIRSHWLQNPNDDIGIFTKNLAVFDADHSAAQGALHSLEMKHGLRASITVRTRKGCHDYFLVPPGVTVRQDSHSTEDHPERIDVRAQRSYIVGPGSTDKTIVTWDVERVSDMTPVTQAFVDDVARHNGRSAATTHTPSEKRAPLGDVCLPRIRHLLTYISPDVGFADWLGIMAAIYHETQGSDAGKALFDSWSSEGDKYEGLSDVEKHWRTFKLDHPDPNTMGTIVMFAQQGGYTGQNRHESDAWFERAVAEAEGLYPELLAPEDVAPPTTVVNNPFEDAALIHVHEQMEKEVQEQRPFLRGLALLGQSTVIYAAPNTGKTLWTMHALIDSVLQGDVDAKDIYYMNADDSGAGLLAKSRILGEHGIRMIGDGYNGFSADKFKPWLQTMIANDQVRGKIFIIDTLTRFFDTHQKGESRSFTKLIGQLTTRGGTFVGLGHTRKNPGLDGHAVYAGTADVVSDFHCVYMLEEISQGAGGAFKTIEFKNTKRRGDVKLKAAFSYSNTPTSDYRELLNSVKPANNEDVSAIAILSEIQKDSRAIAVVQSCIRRGIHTKQALCRTAFKEAGIARSKIEAMLPKYAGTTPGIHFWNYTTGGERGAHVYKILPEHAGGAPVSQVPRFPATAHPQAADDQVPYSFDDEENADFEDVKF